MAGSITRFEDVGELRVRLAGLLPKLARGSHLVMNGMPNEYVEVSLVVALLVSALAFSELSLVPPDHLY